MTDTMIQHIITRIVEQAMDARKEYNENTADAFQQGRHLAYYEILDIIKNELDVRDENLKDYNLETDLEKDYL